MSHGCEEAAQSDVRLRDGGKLLRPEGIRHTLLSFVLSYEKINIAICLTFEKVYGMIFEVE